MSQIVFSGHEGALYVCDADGGSQRTLTSGGVLCVWPSCSPDGRAIAFSVVPSGGNGHGVLGVRVIPTDGSALRQIYENEVGTDAIASRTPHYALWSPDSRKLAFIAQTRSGGLTLFLHDTASDGPPRRLVDGGPLYASWSQDSRFLLIHSERNHYLADLNQEAGLARVPGEATRYSAPAWSPRTNRVAMFRDSGRGKQTLLVGDMDHGRVEAIAEVDGLASIGWSPDGSHIGMARAVGSRSGYYEGLWVVNADTGGETQVADERVLAFFWSPDGGRIAYITPSDAAEGSLRWAVVRADGADVHYLADFRPTQEQMTAFMFFDQYGQSHPRWSSDGASLLFAGALGYRVAGGPLPEGRFSGIFVADSDGESTPRRVGSGTFAAWLPG
ncbi:MAG: hypothetical protein IH862_12745 [Chloroflexi bacterium]|nr:hypothetical protein [Chloroflexota bacterium]